MNHSPIPFLRKPGSLRAEGAHAGAAHDVLLLMEIDVSPLQAVLP